jgi:hypothetical protein
MGVAALAIFILPDFPTTTRWLSPEEQRLAEVRMAEVRLPLSNNRPCDN